ncbi:MAG TPA: OmpA family protein [Candidatus Binatia bacterium]
MMPTKTKNLKVLSIAAVLGFAGCATMPPAALEQAKFNYTQAQQDPQVAKQAPVPLYEAKQLLSRAERNWDDEHDKDEAQHLAYLVDRKVELARVDTMQKTAEAQARALQSQAQNLAETQAEQAEEAKTLAEHRALEAQKARQQAQLEVREAEEARRRAEQARHESEAKALASAFAQQKAEAQAQAAKQAEQREQQALARNKKLQQELADLKARETERGYEVTLSGVLFDLDKATLNPGAMRSLTPLVTLLRDNPEKTVMIEGYTDSLGSAGYNRDLSRRRADAVRDFLIDNGIASQRITARGLGESYPVASNATEAGRQQNRRVDIVISGEQQQTAQAEGQMNPRRAEGSE